MSAMNEAALYRQGTIGLDRVGWTKAVSSVSIPRYSALEESLSTDIVVVGGGLMGCSLALHLAERGASPVLLEAQEIAFGASGRNAGHVATHIEGLKLPAHIKNLPHGGGPYMELVRGGPAAVASVVQRYGIVCNYTPTGHLMLAVRSADLGRLEEQCTYWASKGIPMELLDRDAVRTAMGSCRFAGGLYQRSGGRINSFAYTNGMAAAATKLGAKVFTRSEVVTIDQIDNAWQVQTRQGTVKAKTIVVCTNAYTTSNIPYVSKAFYPSVPGVISFKPLSESVHKALIPCGATISQLGLPGAIQKDSTGRFYFATIPSLGRTADSQPFERTLRRWLDKTFPQLRREKLERETYWTGRTANTLDRLPRIYSPAAGFLAPMVCNGLGISTCTQFGIALAHALADDRYDNLPVALTKPKAAPLRGVYNPLVSILVSGLALRGKYLGA
jgi:glycine/D-amino acid oxidase-like deaminating enzyme